MIIKSATTVYSQITKLKKRGMAIADEDKAKEILLDVGYYRLGFYWFPMEKNYPKKNNRDHAFKENARFEDAVALYYFDNDLRNILSRYLHRIEVNFRTRVIYTVSNHYRNNPTWFADPKIVAYPFIDELENTYKIVRKNSAIDKHHKKYLNDRYAPAWKTLEYMTLGNILTLFNNLKNVELKAQIQRAYGITNPIVFASYMEAIRQIRNSCAHGHNLFDFKFRTPIKKGPLKNMTASQRSSIAGSVMVIGYLLKAISSNRCSDLKRDINRLVMDKQFKSIYPLVRHLLCL